jgi:anti-anti-sigma factor
MWEDHENVVLAVAGELDTETADQLRAAVSSILAAGRPRRLVLDLGEVRFLDARGVAALVAAHRTGASHRMAVVVINCQRMPMRVLEITGVDKLLTSRKGERS